MTMGRIAPLAQGDVADVRLEELLAFAEENNAPDPRMVRVLGRSQAGVSLLVAWHDVLYNGLLPHRLKELVRIFMSVADGCGYCSSIRSTQGRREGVNDAVLIEMPAFETSSRYSDREKCALRYARQFRQNAVDNDAVFDDLRAHFTEPEIIELGVLCGLLHGVGTFARSLQVLSWADACALRPELDDQRTALVGTDITS